MSGTPLSQLILGGIIGVLALGNLAFGWFRSFDWIHKNAAPVWNAIVTPEFQYTLIVLSLMLCGTGLWQLLRQRGRSSAVLDKQVPGNVTVDGTGNNVLGSGSQIKGDVVFGNKATAEGQSARPRPYLTPIRFGPLGLGDEIAWAGPKREAIWLNHDGSVAHNAVFEPMLVGEWTVAFESMNPIAGPNARALVVSVTKPNMPSDPKTGHAQMMCVDDAWRDAMHHGGFNRAGLSVSYTDDRGNKFSFQCSIRRDPNQRGGSPFLIGDFVDTSAQP